MLVWLFILLVVVKVGIVLFGCWMGLVILGISGLLFGVVGLDVVSVVIEEVGVIVGVVVCVVFVFCVVDVVV